MSGGRRRRDTSSQETTLLGVAALAAEARGSRPRRGKAAFDVRRRRALVTVTVLVGLLGAGVAGFATWLTGADDTAAVAAPAAVQRVEVVGPRYTPTAADRARTPDRITPSTPLVALTFDDGPTPERTPFVLDVLAAKGAKATFFFQGDQVEKHPEIARRALAEGHAIGLHSYEHVYFPDLDQTRARDQIVRAEESLTSALGVRPTMWRYPFGEASPAADAVLAERRLVGGVGWDWRSNLKGDFECPGADAVARFVVTESRDEAVILLHDGGDAITCPAPQWDYLPRAIDQVRAKGLEFGLIAPTGRPNGAEETAVVAP
ncbi:polysaccharide deacetylase family protein [Actinomycetospora termitidis]|uniref:Polysaccharide deacetylase family protein n=1 Tax=Actinomycetospora termitidis TaxID=3053470 RepID=A0ABT7MAV8_9PSEU|nr:polysaccharide deacetylase family protein [Actinomycetospora sp. Odt1-22]MDL5157334.1 polysaccharide deacetylase family protein [Actinomycetospora sp. Odt1-22]